MRSPNSAGQQRIVGLAIAAATLFVALTKASAIDGEPHLNYGQLTAEWWEWILEQPVTGNPNLDLAGADAGSDQPRVDVFFIAGAFGGNVTRAFTVPAGPALFLPVLNSVVAVPLPAPRPKPDSNQVPRHVTSTMPSSRVWRSFM